MPDEPAQGAATGPLTFTVSISGDGRFRDTVQALASKTAESAGCGADQSEGFGRAVATILRAVLPAAGGDTATAVRLTWQVGTASADVVASTGSPVTDADRRLAGALVDAIETMAGRGVPDTIRLTVRARH
ncbi:MAG: hypothetical protein U0Q12_26010 [Vicinamibacterales bacterium]